MSEIERVTMTAKESADYLGICYQKLLVLSSTEEIPNVRIGRIYYYTKETLDAWILDQINRPSKEHEAAYLIKKRYPHLTL